MIETVTPANHAEWLAGRKIGASDVAKILGLAPWKDATPIDTWQEKTGRAKPRKASWRMKVGLAMEPDIIAAYQEETGRTIERQQVVVRSDEYPWLSATLDGITAEPRILECKTTSWGEHWGEPGTDEVPDHYQVQVQAQMLCAGLSVADVAVAFLDSDRFAIYTVPRNDETIAAMLPVLAEFWECVQTDTPPSWGRLDARALAILHPTCEGEINIPWAVENDVREYESLGETIKAKEERHEALKVAILAAMGTAKTGQLSDGRQLRRYLSEIAEKEIKYTRAAYTSHYFRITKGR